MLCSLDEVRPEMPYVLESAWRRTHFKAAAGGRDELVTVLTRLLQDRDMQGVLPLRSDRLLGRSEGFRGSASREFGPGAFAELETPCWRGLWRRWVTMRIETTIRDFVTTRSFGRRRRRFEAVELSRQEQGE